jgi:hypothetical protein
MPIDCNPALFDFPGVEGRRVVPSFDDGDGLKDNVIDFLHTRWQRESAQIMRDSTLKEPFHAVLTILVSRGGHAAINLNDRVSGSLNE